MAGRGSRFQAEAEKNPEYRKPKPLIDVKGRPMVEWAVNSLPFVSHKNRKSDTELATAKDLIFVVLQSHVDEHAIDEKLKEIFGEETTVVVIPEVTRGATETVMAAKAYIEPEEELIISDSDHFFEGSSLHEMIANKDEDTAGMIPVFEPPDDEPKWSYTLFDEDKTALAIGEKDPELAKKGAFANIGAYYFSKGKIFTDEAEAMIAENDMSGAPGKMEFYVAPLYARLLNKGLKIKAAVTPQVWGLGTPKDLEYFLENYTE